MSHVAEGLQGGGGGARGRGRGTRRRAGGPGAAGGGTATGADDGDDGGEWAYVNSTHIIADITVEEVPSLDPAAGAGVGTGHPGETPSAQVGGA